MNDGACRRANPAKLVYSCSIPAPVSNMTNFLDTLVAIVGRSYVITERGSQTKYVTDWFGRVTGNALAVVRPSSVNEVSLVVKACASHRVSIVPQGGNTGLVGGALPDSSGKQIVLALDRLNAILHIDPAGKTMTVESGVLLAVVHQAAQENGLEFPLNMGSEGSCTIGGVLSTNAGGTAVLRYGNARDLCLGVQVVTATGEIWDGLRALRKDNTGYDLRDLFIGSEGTLGIVTAAVLKLVPRPKAQLAAMIAVQSPDKAVDLLRQAQSTLGSLLTAFELISHDCLKLVANYFPQYAYPFSTSTPFAVLLEITDHESEDHATASLERLLESSIESGLVTDALIPQTLAQSSRFWEIREHIPLAQVEDGKNIKHDISLPISKIPEFLKEIEAHLKTDFPGSRVIVFGHLGDGNLHFNVAAPPGVSPEDFMIQKSSVNLCIHDLVHALNGSVSAEHGIGSMKVEELRRYKSPIEMGLFRSIKSALDPQGIFNPGKIL